MSYICTFTDIDECEKDIDLCDANAKCNNTSGSYICLCNKGFQMSYDGTCQDADECEIGNHNCKEKNAICNNIVGGFTCLCESGYVMNEDEICEGMTHRPTL